MAIQLRMHIKHNRFMPETWSVTHIFEKYPIKILLNSLKHRNLTCQTHFWTIPNQNTLEFTQNTETWSATHIFEQCPIKILLNSLKHTHTYTFSICLSLSLSNYLSMNPTCAHLCEDFEVLPVWCPPWRRWIGSREEERLRVQHLGFPSPQG